MVNALIKIDDDVNRVLNIVKSRYNLKDKGEAIEFITREYVEMRNEPELRKDFVEKFIKITKQKKIRVDDFAERYGLI